MKKLLTLFFALFFLTACSKEKAAFEAALTEKLQKDGDLKDYHLDPKAVASCVIGEVAQGLPGFLGDPRRDAYYTAYAHFASAETHEDAFQAIEDAKDVFGSVRESRQAALSVASYVMDCMGKIIAETEAQ